MKPKDASKAKYIIGNMVIPVTDEIKAELKGDYTTDNLVRYIRSNPDRIMFLEGSLIVTDWEGLDRWNDMTHPVNIPESDIKHLDDELHEIRRVLANIGTRQEDAFDRVYAVLRNSAPQSKPTLFQRIFKRKKR